jgi:hypothetical protein
MRQAGSITVRHWQPSVTESFALPPDKGVNDVSNPINYTALPDVPQGNEAYAREGNGQT